MARRKRGRLDNTIEVVIGQMPARDPGQATIVDGAGITTFDSTYRQRARVIAARMIHSGCWCRPKAALHDPARCRSDAARRRPPLRLW